MRIVVLRSARSFPLVLLHDAVSGCGRGDIGGSLTTLLLPDPGLDLLASGDGSRRFNSSSGVLLSSFLKSMGIE